MSSQNPSFNPTGYVGTNFTNPGQDYFRRRDPTTTDIHFRPGSRWINTLSNTAWTLGSVVSNSANWIICGGGTLAVQEFLLDDANLVSPIAGVVAIAGDATKGVSTFMPIGGVAEITIADAAVAQKGVVLLADNAEAIAGTDTDKAITSQDLAAKLGVQTANGLLVGQGTSNALQSMSAGAAGQIVQSSGAAVNPVWTTATYPATTTNGQVLLSSATNVVSSSPHITANTAGIVTTPLQSASSAYLNGSVANVTGDGTSYVVVFDVEDYDIQGEYNIATGEFKVTVAGLYLITTAVMLENIAAAHNIGNLWILLNGNPEWAIQYNPGASRESSNQFSCAGATVLKLAPNDLISVHVQVGGSTKTVGVNGTAGSHASLQVTKIA